MMFSGFMQFDFGKLFIEIPHAAPESTISRCIMCTLQFIIHISADDTGAAILLLSARRLPAEIAVLSHWPKTG